MDKPQQVDMRLLVRSVTEGEKTPLPVLEGIRKYAKNHVLLVGKPGSGKSTALRRLLWEEAGNLESKRDGEDEKLSLGVIPVLVELRLSESKTSVVELIKRTFRRNGLQLEQEKIEKLLFESKLLLLLDGLNELPSEESRRLVGNFRRDFPNTPMIFTTRDLAVGGDLGIEKKLEMQPLTLEQMRQFVRAYLPAQGEEMLRRLDGRLRELGETPLILKMLCEVFVAEKQISENRGKLFRTFDERLDELKNRDSLSVTENLHQWKSELLGRLAFTMMQGEKPTDLRLIISQTEAEKDLEDLLKDRVTSPAEKAKNWLQDLLRHYLIQQVDKKQLQFHHQLFQEYYAAEHLLELLPKLSDDKLKQGYLNLLKWTEPIALVLNLLDNEAQAVRVVQLALDVDLMLGAFLAGEVQSKFQQKTIDLILEKKLSKKLEIDLLSKTRSQFAVEYLNSCLKDENSSVRDSAALALGEIGGKAAVNPLIDALKDEDSSVRYFAASALREIGGKAAVNLLIDALKDEDSSVRRYAASALGRIGGEAAVNSLIDALKDEDSSVRRAAASALGGIGGEAAVNFLIDALKDEDSFVRRAAASALGGIGGEAAVNFLIHALKDKDSSVRRAAAYALGGIGGEAAVNFLIHALKDKDSSVRYDAASALGGIGGEAAVNFLIHALKDKDSSVRYHAASALGEIGGEATVNPLIDALKDENSSVRDSAAFALERIGSEAAVNPLIDALKDEDSSVRYHAASALGEIGGEATVNPLIDALKDENSSVRGYAADALGRIGGEAAVNPLIDALKDENSSVRRDAASALGRIGSEAAINPLIDALKDEDLSVRFSAASALGEIATSSILPQMLKMLLNEEDLVQNTILKIQERYKFYNYEIFHS